MISSYRLQYAVLAVLLLSAVSASAQGASPAPQTTPPPQVRTVPAGNMWSHGTTLNVFGGAAAISGDRAAVGGGALGWEFKPWIGLEGTGAWLDWGQRAHGFTAAMTARVSMLTPHLLVPFVAGGVGLYHASFNQFDGTMPGFYRRRMMGVAPQPGQTMTFTDPSLLAGGGLNVFVNRHWTIRPEVMANVVLRDSRSFVVTTGVVRLAYHFEDHVVTPRAGTGRPR
jgi:hypothetical protein